MTNLTPAQARARRARRRAVGKALVALGLVAAGIAVVALLIDVAVIGVPGTVSIACGAVLAPVAQIGAGAAYCAEALAQYGAVGFGLLVVGIPAVIGGVIVWIRARD